MDTPKVSVIIPVYNAEQYLCQCLDSVCTQTLKELEIICVDDGSTDRSQEILKEYAGKDARIRIVAQQNGGAGAARNHGLQIAAGECLSFLDSDDFFEPDMLKLSYEQLQRYQADFVVFNSDQYHMDQEKFVKIDWALRMQDVPPYMPFTHRELTDNVFLSFVGWAWDKLYSREFVLKHNLQFQEQRTTNDMLFVFSALVLAKRIAVVDQILAHQRRGSGASLSVTREKSWHCFYDALTALRKLLKEQDIYWELEQDYINYALHFSLWHLRTLAEPTKQILKEKLCTEWFAELGIEGKDSDYFYNRGEYEEYLKVWKYWNYGKK